MTGELLQGPTSTHISFWGTASPPPRTLVLADQSLCTLLKPLPEQDSEAPPPRRSPKLFRALPLQNRAREEAAGEEEEHWTSGGVAGGASSKGAKDRIIGDGNG
jgi:hypothetical protein